MKDIDKNEFTDDLRDADSKEVSNDYYKYYVLDNSFNDMYNYLDNLFDYKTDDFASIMKMAGIDDNKDKHLLCNLFMMWLFGVKDMNITDIERITKKDKADNKKLGEEFINYFKERPIYDKTKNSNEVKGFVDEYAKMMQNARKKISNKLFASKVVNNMKPIINNWMKSSSRIIDNPNGVKPEHDFMDDPENDLKKEGTVIHNKNLHDNNINSNIENEVDNKIDYSPDGIEKAQNFVKEVNEYKVVRDYILAWLIAVKGSLTINQKNPESNFVKGIPGEGSLEYQEFANNLQRTIEFISDNDKDSSIIDPCLQQLVMYAHKLYYNPYFNDVKREKDGNIDIQDYISLNLTRGPLYFDGVNGAGLAAAKEVCENGRIMYQMYRNARRNISLYSKEKGRYYANLSYNEICDKSQQFINDYKEVEDFSRYVNYKPNADNLFERSKKRLEIKRKLRHFSRTFCNNYIYNPSNPDSYIRDVYQKYGKSVLGVFGLSHYPHHVARYVILKKYLDKVFNPETTNEELNELSNVNIDKLKKDAEKLSKETLFRAALYKDWTSGSYIFFTLWDDIEKDKYLTICNEQMTYILNGRDEKTFIENSINTIHSKKESDESKEDSLKRLVHYMIRKSISMEKYSWFRKMMMADDCIFNSMVKVVWQLVDSEIKHDDPKTDIENYTKLLNQSTKMDIILSNFKWKYNPDDEKSVPKLSVSKKVYRELGINNKTAQTGMKK